MSLEVEVCTVTQEEGQTKTDGGGDGWILKQTLSGRLLTGETTSRSDLDKEQQKSRIFSSGSSPMCKQIIGQSF